MFHFFIASRRYRRHLSLVAHNKLSRQVPPPPARAPQKHRVRPCPNLTTKLSPSVKSLTACAGRFAHTHTNALSCRTAREGDLSQVTSGNAPHAHLRHPTGQKLGLDFNNNCQVPPGNSGDSMLDQPTHEKQDGEGVGVCRSRPASHRLRLCRRVTEQLSCPQV